MTSGCFPIDAIYSDVLPKSTWKSKQNRRSVGVSQKCGALGNVHGAGRSPGHLSRLFLAEWHPPRARVLEQASRFPKLKKRAGGTPSHPATPGAGPTEEHT
ncbi:hypothetical protein SAV14893_038120 [Streptomyces avermitilis]|uniref:Uncharacterized protein n=1 Tax=Streptomyces avermitilis TaxID=33903 RepID=A0A4D4M0M6_STRAX|nr:hypothetical protein SAVMC3_50110 [Streptomyces avermitilis]GDY64419.1 hypothetical protein SAV14893_038120 [Streptomyces avermitilis]GDY75411.1 hypothetical protein SAV31267_048960 [Streptomyces avermitilis]GDY84405.1 hypothetical protein SAVCW2_36040 [Streptomyces avermitilis]